ncbi:MAG: sulfatase-like hydrolase/transferase [Verrucomicrobiota bacterium]
MKRNPTTRRRFMQTTAAAAAAATFPELAPARDGAARPNVLFVLTDQWRFSSLGIGSDKIVRTPFIDQLAAQGAHWTRAYAANPVCTPNRSCILTGRYSHQTGMIRNNLMIPPEEICFPEIFRKAGYATHYVGKWHVDGEKKPGFVPPGWRRRGFDTFEGFNRGHYYHKPSTFDNAGNLLTLDGDPSYYEPSYQTDRAMAFMHKNRENPFLCYLSWGPPHTPFKPPPAFQKYRPGEIQFRENVPKSEEKQAAKDLAGYYGLCESLDHEMGRLMKFLERNDLAKNTLVVFTSDHGELAGSHGKYRKGQPEEESLHVPLIMRLPGRFEGGKQVDTLINSIDLMPTLLKTCHLEVPAACAGRDLSDPDTTVESIYCEGALGATAPRQQKKNENFKNWRTLVTPQHKMTLQPGENPVVQLFDLQKDPFERENLANRADQAAIQKELLAQCRAWAEKTEDPWPNPARAAQSLYSDEEATRARA